MYSDKGNVLQLVALLKAHSITHIVLSPGSRNSPLIHSFATDKDFTCYTIVDERSAGFFAIGVMQAINKPVAVCCTSGTAVLNLGSSVAEAYYQQLPLLVITADRPQAWIGQMDGQTIPQTHIFRNIIRHSVQLPQVNGSEEAWYCNRLINEAIHALDNGVKGPAHINIPLAEPLFGFNTEELPEVRVIRKSSVGYQLNDKDQYDKRFNAHPKRLIVVGQLLPQSELSDRLKSLHEEYGVVVLAEHLSNIEVRETYNFDTMLYAASEEDLKALKPDLLITLGGHIVSKRLKQFLRSQNIREHWHISPDGEVVDTFQCVTDIVKCDEKTFLDYLIAKGEKNNNAFRSLWESHCAEVSQPEAAFSDLSAVGMFMKKLPAEVALQLGNSNSVRFAQLYNLDPYVQVFCNRGTNGIDGSLSTAVGYAAASEKQTFLLIGDLSFFYDMNGLWNKYKRSNLHILLNNNSGGEIFHILPGLNKSEALQDHISAFHQTDAKAWAAQQGFTYLSANNQKELEQQLPEFMNTKNDKPVLLEVFTSMQQNAEQIRAYYHQQKNKIK